MLIQHLIVEPNFVPNMDHVTNHDPIHFHSCAHVSIAAADRKQKEAEQHQLAYVRAESLPQQLDQLGLMLRNVHYFHLMLLNQLPLLLSLEQLS
jgi:hypothetical protein